MLGQFSKLNSNGFERERLGSPAIDHTLALKKGVIEKDFAMTKKKTFIVKRLILTKEPPSDLGKSILCIMIVCTEVLISYLCSPEL